MKNKVKIWRGWLLFKKDAILIRDRLRVIVRILDGRGVPSLQSFSNTKRAFVDNSRMIQIIAIIK